MTMSHPLGTLARIWRFPVKSLAAESLQRATLDDRGLAGDRASALFVATAGHARAGKTYRGKEHERLHTIDTPSAARALGSGRGVDLHLREAGPYFDDAPVSIVFDTWIAALETLVGEGLDPLRFRANLFVHATSGFSLREADLVGKTLAIGNARLRCIKTTERCVTPSYDVATGARNARVARAIALDLENVLGVYCSVERSGSIGIGETLAFES